MQKYLIEYSAFGKNKSIVLSEESAKSKLIWIQKSEKNTGNKVHLTTFCAWPIVK